MLKKYALKKTALFLTAISFGFSVSTQLVGEEIYKQARIVGGKDTVISDMPWQVAIVNDDQDIYNSQYCGGSIIHAQWIVTAAHCVDGLTALQAGFIAAGVTDLSAPAANAEIIAIKTIYVHENFNVTSLDNDIALIELSREIDFSLCGEACSPITRVDPDNEGNVIPAGTPVIVSGWGSTASSLPVYPSLLQSAEINTLDCLNSNYSSADISDNMICAAAPDTDSCTGDSGGPLTAANSTGTGQVLVGLTSWGPLNCATTNEPGVYTRMAQYSCWINDTSQLDISCIDTTDTGTDTGTNTDTGTDTGTDTSSQKGWENLGSTHTFLFAFLILLNMMRFRPKKLGKPR
ncbi:MAG: serine protease [Pseudomonadales bacterium]|nr:serine protease [Pseudomonadales bacterium]